MAAKHRKFTPEFRAQAVTLAIESGNIAKTARDIGIGGSTLNKWVLEYRRSNTTTDGYALSPSEVERLKQLEKDNARLTMENEFLKKAAVFFAKNQVP